MRIIEIAALSNGAHRNQTGNFNTVPDGWAVIPDDMKTENFPFGTITVDDSMPPVVTSWTPGEIPERTEGSQEDSQSVTLEGLAAEVETLKQEAEQAKLDRQALSILLTGEEAET